MLLQEFSRGCYAVRKDRRIAQFVHEEEKDVGLRAVNRLFAVCGRSAKPSQQPPVSVPVVFKKSLRFMLFSPLLSPA